LWCFPTCIYCTLIKLISLLHFLILSPPLKIIFNRLHYSILFSYMCRKYMTEFSAWKVVMIYLLNWIWISMAQAFLLHAGTCLKLWISKPLSLCWVWVSPPLLKKDTQCWFSYLIDSYCCLAKVFSLFFISPQFVSVVDLQYFPSWLLQTPHQFYSFLFTGF
jgi:hypothetical protein